MALNVLKGRRNRRPAQPAPPPPPIDLPVGDDSRGEIFSCPRCGRPLAVGTSRCPNCRTHLVGGVQLGRAVSFVVLGVAVGVLVGLSLAIVLTVAQNGLPAFGPAATAPISSAPAAVETASPSPSASAAATIPPGAGNALRIAATIEDRFIASAADLRRQLRSGTAFTASGAATTLRVIASDAAWGSDAIAALDVWSEAAPIRAQVRDFCMALRVAAREALDISLNDTKAYRASAQKMYRMLGSAAATRAAIVALGAANGIEIPAAQP